MTPGFRPFLAVAATLLLIPALRAQSPAPVPPAQAPPAATPIPTLRASTRLVVVDVVVQDRNGKPIHDLKQADFRLTESGQPETISHFEEHASNPATAAKLSPMPKMDPGTYTNYTPAPPEGAINILLLDALNTPMQDQAFVRDQMLKYLKTPHPGARMAIFGLNKQLHMLQGFTADPDMLRNAIAGKKNLPSASALLDDPVSGNTYGTNTLSDDMADAGMTADAVANMQQFEAQFSSFQLQLRAQYTLDAMDSLGRYLSGIPGRKNLIWFSGSFPVDIMPNADLENPFAAMISMEDEYRETVNLLAAAQVSVYPIDARGLMPPPMFTAANSGAKYAKSPSAMGKDSTKFFNDTASEHGTMLQMAEDTGGKAFINTNGLAEAVSKAIDNGSNYYTLTYTPSKAKWQGEYRKINVKLDGQPFQLSYRRGYYADDPDAKSSKGTPKVTVSATASTVPFNPLHLAMLFGAPQPTQIIFAATVRPTTGESEPTATKDTDLQPKVTGPFVRYTIIYAANARKLVSAPAENGTRHLELEFLTTLYDDQGTAIASTGNRIQTDLSPERYQAMLKGGIQYAQQLSIPVKGNYFLRVGIADTASGKVGAIELPLDSVKRLKTIKQEAEAETAAAAAKKAAQPPAPTPPPAPAPPPAPKP